MKKDLHKALKSMTKQGFVVERTAGLHYSVFTSDGTRITTFSGSPSDHRALNNALAPMRNAGWIDPKRPQKKRGKRY